MNNLVDSVIHGSCFIVLYLVIIVIAKFINDILTPYSVDNQLTNKDNNALAISISGYFIAITAIFLGGLFGPSKGLLEDLLIVSEYTAFGIVLLNISRVINDKLILYKFSNVKEIIKDRNAGTGAVQFGSYIASGLIIAGSIHGESGSSVNIVMGFLTTFAFFCAAQVSLILFTFIYNLVTPYDIHDEIEKDNVAAGVSLAGALIAIGIILMKGASGNFISWKYNFSKFGLDALLIFILLPIVRIFFDKLIIPKSDLSHEIKNDRNLGAAFLEASIMISFSIVLLSVLG